MILNITSYPRSGNSFFSTTMLQFGTQWLHNGADPVEFRPAGRIYASAAVDAGIYAVKVWPYCDGSDGYIEDPQPDRYIDDPDAVYVYKRHDYPDKFAGPRIYLIRDGRDVLYSFAHHNAVNKAIVADKVNQELIVKRPTPIEDINREAEIILADPNAQWGRIAEEGVGHPNTVAVVKYEDMKRDPLFYAKLALAQAGYSVEKVQEPPTWAALKEFAPHFYWRGTPGGYRNLDPKIVAEFEDRNRNSLRRFGYE